jgi:hypothetical protein
MNILYRISNVYHAYRDNVLFSTSYNSAIEDFNNLLWLRRVAIWRKRKSTKFYQKTNVNKLSFIKDENRRKILN